MPANPWRILDFAPSYDGRLLAYTLQVGGSEIGELHLMDVQTGQHIAPPIDRVRFAGVGWLRDGSGFFFSRLREGYDKLPDTEKFGDRTGRDNYELLCCGDAPSAARLQPAAQ